MTNKEDFRKIADDPQFVEGIYNYCDRWCERCRFRLRCANYSISEQQLLQDGPEADADGSFWENVNEMFEVTVDMIREIAEEKGIDLDHVSPETYEEQRRIFDEKSEAYSCTHAASDYIEMVEEWFRSADHLLEGKEDELSMKAEILEFDDSDPSGEADEIDNAIEVIRWYQPQIYVKCMRAVQGLSEPGDNPQGASQYDADGSAKVALIEIDRSIASWGVLYRYFSQTENEIIDILVHLDRLRKNVEMTFPHAREFIRPGFDEEQYQEAV
jgi:hypothetical protein